MEISDEFVIWCFYFFRAAYSQEHLTRSLRDDSNGEWTRLCEEDFRKQFTERDILRKSNHLLWIMSELKLTNNKELRESQMNLCDKVIFLYGIWFPRVMKAVSTSDWVAFLMESKLSVDMGWLYGIRKSVLVSYDLQAASDKSGKKLVRKLEAYIHRATYTEIKELRQTLGDFFSIATAFAEHLQSLYADRGVLSIFHGLREREIRRVELNPDWAVLNFAKKCDVVLLQMVNAFSERCLLELQKDRWR